MDKRMNISGFLAREFFVNAGIFTPGVAVALFNEPAVTPGSFDLLSLILKTSLPLMISGFFALGRLWIKRRGERRVQHAVIAAQKYNVVATDNNEFRQTMERLLTEAMGRVDAKDDMIVQQAEIIGRYAARISDLEDELKRKKPNRWA